MPLPLGHIAIGLAAHEVGTTRSAFSRWKLFAAIVVLSNLPDIDVIIGLLFQWNGSAFHRGLTHSLLFALSFGFLASRAAAIWDRLPRLGFWICFSLILSHVVADALLSTSAVSFFWPLETNWSTGHSGWRDVISMVLKGDEQDAWIALSCAAVIMVQRAARSLKTNRLLRPVSKSS
jgi:inner membrane protein